MNRLIAVSLLVGLCLLVITAIGAASTRTARAEPDPCALPERMPAEIQLHDGMSATEAMLESAFGNELEGKSQ